MGNLGWGIGSDDSSLLVGVIEISDMFIRTGGAP